MSYLLRFSLTGLTSGVSFFALGLVIPLLSREMHFSLTENSWLLGIFSIAVIIFSPLWGTLSDKLQKRKPFLVIGILVFALCSFLQFFSYKFTELLIIRFFQGAAFGTSSMLNALFTDHFGAQAANRFAFFSASNALGFAIGSLVSGFFAEWFGVRSAFLLSGGMAILVVFLIQFLLPDSPPITKKTAKTPLPSGLSYLYATVFIRQTAAMAFWSIFPIYMLSFVDNLAVIGAVNSSNMFVQPFFIIWMGRMAERWDHLKMVRWGIVGSVITFLVLGAANNLGLIVLGQIMIAFSWSMMFIGMNMYMMERTNEHNRGRAFGLLQAAFMTAMASGPFLGGPLADAFGIHTMIFIMSGLMTLSLVVLWRLRVLEKISDAPLTTSPAMNAPTTSIPAASSERSSSVEQP